MIFTRPWTRDSWGRGECAGCCRHREPGAGPPLTLPASALENLTIDAPEHTWRAWWPGCFHNLTTILPLWIIHKFNQNKDPIYSIDTYSSMTTTWSGLKLSALRTIRHITAPQWCCNPQLVSVFCILGHVTPDTKVATLLPAADNAVITSSGSYLLMGGGSVYLVMDHWVVTHTTLPYGGIAQWKNDMTPYFLCLGSKKVL